MRQVGGFLFAGLSTARTFGAASSATLKPIATARQELLVISGEVYESALIKNKGASEYGNTVMDLTSVMGVDLLTEEQYFELQKLGDFDTKTSSGIKTPADIRKLRGALYCDRRCGRVFVGRNGPVLL